MTVEFSQVESKPRRLFSWLAIAIITGVLALWSISLISVVRADVVQQGLDIAPIEKCRDANAVSDGVYVWDFRYGCQMLRERD